MIRIQVCVDCNQGYYLVAVFSPLGPWNWHCKQYMVRSSVAPVYAFYDSYLKGKKVWEGVLEGLLAVDDWCEEHGAYPLVWA